MSIWMKQVNESKLEMSITHATPHADHESLMVLLAMIHKGNKSLKVNVMLATTLTGSYMSEAAAEELMLQGRRQQLSQQQAVRR